MKIMKRHPQPFSQREIFDRARSDYSIARSTRFSGSPVGVPSGGAGADYHIRSEFQWLKAMEIARELARNDSLVGVGVQRYVELAVQDGIKLKPNTGNKAVDEALAEGWEEFTDQDSASLCHAGGEFNFNELEKLALAHQTIDGDIVFLPGKDGRLEPIEAHRVITPRNTKRNVVHGVLLNERRQRLEYWVTKEEVDPNRLGVPQRVGDMRQIPTLNPKTGARQVFHVYRPKRVSQTRGVTALAPVADPAAMLDDIQFAKLVQQQVVSCVTFFREREAGAQAGRPGQVGTEVDDAEGRYVEEIKPGLEIAGAPGEKLQGFSPNVPNSEYFEQASMITRVVAINLGIPAEVLLLDPRQTNFSGWRGSLEITKIGIRQGQIQLCSFFHRQVYRWRVDLMISKSPALRKAAKELGRAIYKVVCHFPIFPYMEPVKDVQSDALRLKNGFTSRRRFHAERNSTWDAISTEIVEDHALAIRKAKVAAAKLNEEFQDDPVHWRELLSLPAPDGMTITGGSTGGGGGGGFGEGEPEEGNDEDGKDPGDTGTPAAWMPSSTCSA